MQHEILTKIISVIQSKENFKFNIFLQRKTNKSLCLLFFQSLHILIILKIICSKINEDKEIDMEAQKTITIAY